MVCFVCCADLFCVCVGRMVFLVMLRYCAGLLVWMSIVLGVGLFVVAGAAAFVYAPYEDTHTQRAESR